MSSDHPPLPMERTGDVDHAELARDLAVIDQRVRTVEFLGRAVLGGVFVIVLSVVGATIAAAVTFGEMRAQVQSLEKRLDRHYDNRGATASK